MKIVPVLFLFLSILICSGCSSSQQEDTKEEKSLIEEKYVFDNLDIDTSLTMNSADLTVSENIGKFIVQAGAFLSKTRAENFCTKLKTDIKQEVIINFDSTKNLYLIQCTPVENRAEAEEIVQQLTKKNYSDAFIIKVEK